MHAHEPVCKATELIDLHASLCNCMQAYATVCKLLHAFLFTGLYASLYNYMQAHRVRMHAHGAVRKALNS